MLLSHIICKFTICWDVRSTLLLQNKLNIKIMNTVTYTLENGTKIVQPINKECFVNQKGNKISESALHQLFSDTAWDKRAVKYTIDSETNESVTTEKEIHFTKNERRDSFRFN